MTEKIIHIPIGYFPHFPKVTITINKTKGFKYCVALIILKEGNTYMLCYCDNCHGKGHHIHFCYPNETIQKPFNFQGFSETTEHFKNHWKEIMIKVEKDIIKNE